MSSDKFKSLQKILPDVSRETFSDLMEFEQLFLKWSSAINLASPATLSSLWERHILDSVQIFPLVPEAKKWVDIGSGGGFPGVVIALILKQWRNGHMDLVESNGKKAAFLRTAIGQFNAPGRVHALRIDAAYAVVPSADVVTARALAPLPDLFELAEPWLTGGAVGLFHKGRDYHREVSESRHAWSFDLVEYPSVIADDSVVLKVSNLQRVL